MRAATFTAVVGLHGSASTWAFNIAREQLAAAYGETSVYGFSTERTSDVLQDRQCLKHHVLWKVHAGDAWTEGLMHLAQARVVVTIRDPRDALLSFSRRFEPVLERGVRVLQRDCLRARAAVTAGALVLRYEEDFMDDRRAIERIADHLGLTPSPALNAALLERYCTASVRTFAGRVKDLPADRLVDGYQGDQYDRVTHIHANHIGAARAGGWREAWRDADAAQVTAAFAEFLDHFGYAR